MFNRMHRGAVAGALALVAAFTLSSCTIAPVDKNFTLDGKDNTGVVYLSMTRVGTLAPSIWLKMRGIDTKASGFVALDDFDVKREWAEVTSTSNTDFGHATLEKPIGTVVAFALPAGQYEFYNWYGSSPMWNKPGDDYDIKSQGFSVKFTVKPGAVTYAGSLQIRVPDYINPENYTGQFEMAVSDQQARDKEVLQRKYPNLSDKSSSTVVMNTNDAGRPLTYYTWPVSGKSRNGGGSGFN